MGRGEGGTKSWKAASIPQEMCKMCLRQMTKGEIKCFNRIGKMCDGELCRIGLLCESCIVETMSEKRGIHTGQGQGQGEG